MEPVHHRLHALRSVAIGLRSLRLIVGRAIRNQRQAFSIFAVREQGPPRSWRLPLVQRTA